MTTPRLYRLTEAADLRGLPRQVLREAARTGVLPVVRFSPRGRYRVTLDDVDHYIAAHRVSPAVPVPLRPLPVVSPVELRRLASADLTDLMPPIGQRRFS